MLQSRCIQRNEGIGGAEVQVVVAFGTSPIVLTARRRQGELDNPKGARRDSLKNGVYCLVVEPTAIL